MQRNALKAVRIIKRVQQNCRIQDQYTNFYCISIN